jgi:AraC-like DNA-binding protein
VFPQAATASTCQRSNAPLWHHRGVSASLFANPYREIAPPPELRDLVRCFWLRREHPAAGSRPQRVLPDNCADWIFDLSAVPSLAGEHDGGGGAGARRAVAVGPMTRPLVVEPRAGSVLFGVRFAPGRWRRLFGGEALAMQDRRCDLLELDQETGGAPGRLLARLHGARDDRSLVAAAADELRGPAADAAGDPLVMAALAALEARCGDLRIETLAHDLGCTRQHLAARFRLEVGLTPKTYGAVLRFRAAMAEGTRARPRTWTDVALRFGYGDQSHLLRDFRRFAGAPPSRLSL